MKSVIIIEDVKWKLFWCCSNKKIFFLFLFAKVTEFEIFKSCFIVFSKFLFKIFAFFRCGIFEYKLKFTLRLWAFQKLFSFHFLMKLSDFKIFLTVSHVSIYIFSIFPRSCRLKLRVSRKKILRVFSNNLLIRCQTLVD